MNCEELRARLDAYIDGELSQEEQRAFEAHAAACADCGRELEMAKLVRDALGEMDDEVAVPLNVQAGWRNAVRAEAKRRTNRRWLRAAYGAAAALVLVIGATALMRNMPAQQDIAPRTIAVEPTDAVVARDGELEAAAIAMEEEAYAAWKKYLAEDMGAACVSVEALIQEYSGEYTLHMYEDDGLAGGGYSIYRIELPREYLDDFLSAASHIGAEQDSETAQTQGETALVYIQINESGEAQSAA